jgi:hypothetical protein
MIPRIIHFIFFPWDKQHKLKADETDFDHTAYFTMQRYAPDFETRLWTFSKAREFCLGHYPAVWDVVHKCPHPTMMVDILRWVVVHHFGGIYWQMSTTPLANMNNLMPSAGKTVRLFTEFVLTPEQCQRMAAEPIRNGEPEEPVRVLNQVFAAQPQTPFIQKHLDLILERNCTYTPRKDYDVLFIGANAALSTSYDQFGKNDPTVELINLEDSKRLLKWRYLGSWRKDTPPSAVSSSRLVPQSPRSSRMDRIPVLAAAYFRWVKRHAHEQWLTQLDVTISRTSVLSHLEPWIKQKHIQSICEAPCGNFQPINCNCTYIGGDPNRVMVRKNRRQSKIPNVHFKHVNMLHTRFPTVDLFVCPDFLDWLSFAEIRRVLSRILISKPRFLALTGYSLLAESWDAAFGDFRPLNPRLAPFQFPEPLDILQLPPTSTGRPDRSLFLWPTQTIRQPHIEPHG